MTYNINDKVKEWIDNNLDTFISIAHTLKGIEPAIEYITKKLSENDDI